MSKLKELLEKLQDAEKIHKDEFTALPDCNMKWVLSGKVDAFNQCILAVQQMILQDIGKDKIAVTLEKKQKCSHKSFWIRGLSEIKVCNDCGENLPD